MDYKKSQKSNTKKKPTNPAFKKINFVNNKMEEKEEVDRTSKT